MKKKISLVAVFFVVLILSLVLSNVSLIRGENPVNIECKCSGVVDKAPGESFTVKITFKNTGHTVGSWSVNIVFEGEKWSWSGTAQNLILNPCHKKTLTWKGSVPKDASANSVARLVVYFDGEFVPLDWWIHVVEDAELKIVSSSVE